MPDTNAARGLFGLGRFAEGFFQQTQRNDELSRLAAERALAAQERTDRLNFQQSQATDLKSFRDQSLQLQRDTLNKPKEFKPTTFSETLAQNRKAAKGELAAGFYTVPLEDGTTDRRQITSFQEAVQRLQERELSAYVTDEASQPVLNPEFAALLQKFQQPAAAVGADGGGFDLIGKMKRFFGGSGDAAGPNIRTSPKGGGEPARSIADLIPQSPNVRTGALSGLPSRPPLPPRPSPAPPGLAPQGAPAAPAAPVADVSAAVPPGNQFSNEAEMEQAAAQGLIQPGDRIMVAGQVGTYQLQ